MNYRKSCVEKMVLKIPGIRKSEVTSIEETFQNEVLRPILKFQNEIIATYSNTIIFKKAKIRPETETIEIENKLKSIISNDLQVRNTLLGMVIGLMTSDQLLEYLKKEPAYKKRIFSMMIKRILSIVR